MGKKLLRLDIVSAEKPVFNGVTTMLIVTGEMGELGIMPGHTQLITKIKPGQIRIQQEEGEELLFYVSGGLMEVQPYVVTIMADTVVRAEDLDEAQAAEAEQKAREALSKKKDGITDRDLMITQLAEASAMMRVLKELKKLRK